MIASIPPLKRLTGVQSQVQKGIAAADSIFQVLDTEAEKDGGSYEVDRVNGALEFRNVSFGYGSSDRRCSVTSASPCRLEASQHWWVIQAAARQPWPACCPGFTPAIEGQIFLDGHELSDYTLNNLRSHVSLVSQNVVLFNDTVAGNIAYGALA